MRVGLNFPLRNDKAKVEAVFPDTPTQLRGRGSEGRATSTSISQWLIFVCLQASYFTMSDAKKIKSPTRLKDRMSDCFAWERRARECENVKEFMSSDNSQDRPNSYPVDMSNEIKNIDSTIHYHAFCIHSTIFIVSYFYSNIGYREEHLAS